MKLRKFHKFRHENGRDYTRINCPDSSLYNTITHTTRAISTCRKCIYNKGHLNDTVGTFVRCAFINPSPKLNGKWVSWDRPYYITQSLMTALIFFNIHPDQLISLSQLKRDIKKKRQHMLPIFHPDTTSLNPIKAQKGLTKLQKMHKRIKELKILPNKNFENLPDYRRDI